MIVAGDGFDVEIVIAHAKQRIADFKVPQYVALREQPLPRNPGGKVLKRQLREQTEWASRCASAGGGRHRRRRTKPSALEERAWVAHHLVDLLSLTPRWWSAGITSWTTCR